MQGNTLNLHTPLTSGVGFKGQIHTHTPTTPGVGSKVFFFFLKVVKLYNKLGSGRSVDLHAR